MTPTATEQLTAIKLDPIVAPHRGVFIGFGSLFLVAAIVVLRLVGRGVTQPFDLILIGGTVSAIASGLACFGIVGRISNLDEEARRSKFLEDDEIQAKPREPKFSLKLAVVGLLLPWLLFLSYACVVTVKLASIPATQRPLLVKGPTLPAPVQAAKMKNMKAVTSPQPSRVMGVAVQ